MASGRCPLFFFLCSLEVRLGLAQSLSRTSLMLGEADRALAAEGERGFGEQETSLSTLSSSAGSAGGFGVTVGKRESEDTRCTKQKEDTSDTFVLIKLKASQTVSGRSCWYS